jgi:hypothetical protein
MRKRQLKHKSTRNTIFDSAGSGLIAEALNQSAAYVRKDLLKTLILTGLLLIGLVAIWLSS